VLVPEIIIQFLGEGGKEFTAVLTTSQFEELRRQVAYVL